MVTTSLKLPDAIKQRVVNSARELSLSPHAFMVQAIEQAVTAAELQAAFLADAKNSHDQTLTTGRGYEAEEVHRYVLARIGDQTAARPRKTHWRR